MRSLLYLCYVWSQISKIFIFLSLAFFLNFIFLSPLYSQAFAPKALDWEQAQQILHQSLQPRDGIILWRDLKTGEQKVLGNPRLLDKRFLPGSVLKLITAEAALLTQQELRYHCHGHENFSGEVQWCWDPNGHGTLTMPEAIAHSCNLYFAKLGGQLNWADLKRILESYPFAASKNLPTNPKRLNWLVIGEDPSFQVTPQEIAKFWEQLLGKLEQEKYQAIRTGLELAAERGTAKLASQGLGFKILAKTGTASSGRQDYKTNAWFLAAYPAEAPRFALVIFMKNARGYNEAAKLAQSLIKILSYN